MNQIRKKRQEMADGWAAFCMLADPIAAWESLYSPERVAVDERELGGVSAIVAPFVYLAERGTSESLGAEIVSIRITTAIIRRRALSTVEDTGIETVKHLDALVNDIERMRRAAAFAEKLLRKHGWKFDPATGKVREAAKRKGGDFLATLIRRLGVEYGSNASARERIKRDLSPIFADNLDAGPRGNIARSLENLRRPSTR